MDSPTLPLQLQGSIISFKLYQVDSTSYMNVPFEHETCVLSCSPFQRSCSPASWIQDVPVPFQHALDVFGVQGVLAAGAVLGEDLLKLLWHK
jgi:hypothetical protein